MIRRATVIAAVVALSLAGLHPSAAGRGRTASSRTAGHIEPITAVPIATGLAFPAAFTVGNDGRIYYGERLTGEVRIFNPANGSDTLWAQISNLRTEGERGLLGVALLPGTLHLVGYVYATRDVGGVPTNQILRLTSIVEVVFSSDVPAQIVHNGGRILFGPDGNLYTVIGDAADRSNAQNLANDAGKVLRMTPSGGVPGDNPFPGSHIWAYGIRNSYGFNFDPLTGRIWETENGPECNDEINLIDKGANYAWGPRATCSTPPPPPQNTNQDGPNPVMPLAWWSSPTAPTGAAFCVGCGMPSSEGALFFGHYNTRQVTRVILNAQRDGIASMGVVYTHPRPILSMERGPDKVIYFSDTSGIYKLVET